MALSSVSNHQLSLLAMFSYTSSHIFLKLSTTEFCGVTIKLEIEEEGLVLDDQRHEGNKPFPDANSGEGWEYGWVRGSAWTSQLLKLSLALHVPGGRTTRSLEPHKTNSNKYFQLLLEGGYKKSNLFSSSREFQMYPWIWLSPELPHQVLSQHSKYLPESGRVWKVS